MQVVGHDELDRPVVSTLSGLEKLDLEEILRHRYLGVFGDAPSEHFLGSSHELTFGGDGGEVGKCWKRTTTRERPRETRLWQDTYHEIGRISSWLALPGYVRDEITRIYANLKAQRSTIKAGLSREKQLAKITWLACLIHRLPRTREEINRGLKELYGFGNGKIPKEFVKAANTRWTKFTLENVGNKTYLYTCERIDGERARHRCLGTI
jgi:hypothetical protein